MRRRLTILLTVVIVLCVQSCTKDVGPKQAVRQAMEAALNDLQRGDCDAYFRRLDFDGDLDSLKSALLLQTIVLQQSELLRTGRMSTASRVVDVKMETDSMAVVYYRLYYSNGDSTENAQKMVCSGGQWKLRMRN